MKSIFGTALAALISAAAAKDDSSFAVLRFTNKGIMQGRVDPIVSPGKTASHVHTVMGGSAFSKDSTTGEDLLASKCTNAMIKGDFSNYWFPSLYFRDPDTKELESVDVMYVNVYYFFEPTDDELKAFPPGLQIVGGDPWTRTAPKAGSKTNLDPSKGAIQNVKWTCPRLNNVYEPPSWPKGSDGSRAGIGDPINLGEGVGFPDVTCDGTYSPLRADVHLPSCYNPEAGLTNYKNNMAWPEDNGSGKMNCPKGYIHVPHLFYEVYWETPAFKDRWTGGQGSQPFVLSNGDVTGFSSHVDFMAGWETDVLQNIIDTCDAGTLGMDKCPGVTVNNEDCTIEPQIQEQVAGKMKVLPGNNPLLGWDFGLDGLADLVKGIVGSSDTDDSEAAPQPSSSSAGLPEASQPATNVVENPVKPEATADAEVNAQAPAPSSAPVEAPVEAAAEEPATTTSCSTKNIHTVWETVTVTDSVYAQPTGDLSARSNDNNNSTGPVAGFQYAGCFKDAEDRVLSGAVRPDIGKVSNEKCVSHCKEAGFLLAGTESGGECYCGNELVGSEHLDDTDCSTPCIDDAASVCGGDFALSVYSESGEANVKSAKGRRHLHAHHLHGHRRSH